MRRISLVSRTVGHRAASLFWIWTILGWIACCGFTASASAGTPEWDLSLGPSKGHAIEVVTKGRRVEVVVSRGLASASYVTEGKITGSGVVADLGAFGSIRGKFVPSNRVLKEAPDSGCSGRPALVRFGRFEGFIRFRGEGGYVDVRRAAVAGTRRHVAWDCSVRNEEEAPKAKLRKGASGIEARLNAGQYFFVALHSGGADATTSFVASTREKTGRIEIERRVFTVSDADDAYVAGLNDVTVAPPLPFFGAASFVPDGYGASRWTGTLGAAFPGAPRQSLIENVTHVGPLGSSGLQRMGHILEWLLNSLLGDVPG